MLIQLNNFTTQHSRTLALVYNFLVFFPTYKIYIFINTTIVFLKIYLFYKKSSMSKNLKNKRMQFYFDCVLTDKKYINPQHF
jgi:hypothetical protein